MKLKLLTVAILGLNLVACANQPINSHTTALNQKVYEGYEHLVGKESYAFDGRSKIEIRSNNNNTVTQTKKTEDIAAEQAQSKAVLSKVLANHHVLPEQSQWMLEGFQKQQQGPDTSAFSNKMGEMLRVLSGRFYYDYAGIIDLSRGQLSLDSKFGYEAKNAQASLKFPLALDLKNDKAYADLSALSPFLMDAQYDGRYVAFDFGTLLTKFNIDKKPLLALIREYMLVNAALAKASDYQTIALADDTKQHGVERIRYQSNYHELMAQYALFFYLNEPYIKSIVKPSSEQDQKFLELFSPMKMGMGGLQPDEINSLLEQQVKTAPDSLEKTASAATVRLQTTLSVAEAKLIAAEDEAAAEQAQKDIAQDARAMEEEDVASTENDQLVTNQMEQALKQFAAYQSTGKLVSAMDVKKSVAEQPAAYQQLTAVMREPLKEMGLVSDHPFIVDTTLDAKGRIIRSELQMDVNLHEKNLKNIHFSMLADIHSYGQAKIDPKIFANAIPASELSTENTFFGAKKSATPQVTTGLSSATWNNQQRYEKLAQSLIAQKINFIDAYTLLYQYAYILENELDESDEDFDIAQFTNTARWNAIYFAEENGLAVTAAQSKEYEDSPEEWYYYDEELSDELWSIFEDMTAQQKDEALYKKFRQQYKKDDAKVFAAMYYAIDEENEKKRMEMSTIDYPVGFNAFVKTLGEIAAEDLKTQKVDAAKLAQFTVREFAWFDAETYERTYAQFLK